MQEAIERRNPERTRVPLEDVLVELRPEGFDEAFEADAKVRHAQLLISQSKYREALPLLKRAQAIKPRDNVAQYLDQVERLAATK